MQKLVLVIGMVFSPLLAMELARFNERPCVGNSLVRPDGRKLSGLSLSELQDSHIKVVDAALYPFLEKIIADSHFTGKFWLKKSGLTDEFWHKNITLSKENVLDNYLILLAKNGRCKISKPMKHDIIGIRAFSSVVEEDRKHNWSYLKKVEPILVVAHNNEYVVQVNDERNRKSALWTVFEADIIEEDEGEWLEQLKNEYAIQVNDIPVDEGLLHSNGIAFSVISAPFEPASQQGTIGWLKDKMHGVYGWCTENPKKAFGLAIGTGVLGWLAYKNYIGEEPVQKVIESVQQVVIQPMQEHAPRRVYVPYYARAGMGLSNGLGNLR